MLGASALLLSHWRSRLHESEERFRKLSEASFEGIAIHRDGTIVMANEQLAAMCGYSLEELIGTSVTEIATPEYVGVLKENLATGSEQPYRGIARKRDGTKFEVQLRGKAVSYQGRAARVAAVADISAETAAMEALRQSESRYRQLFESNLAGVFEMTEEGDFVACNDACARMLGFQTGRALLDARFHLDYCDVSDAEHLRELLRRQRSVVNAEICVRRADGVQVWLLINVSLSEEAEGKATLRGTIVDVTDRHRAEQQAEFQMYHDALTHLPNRALFREQLQVAVAHASRQGSLLAVMLLDLDRFKNINDTLGHGVGDELIRLVAKRVITAVRAGDTLCRSGGDEFAVILPGLRDEEEALVVAQSILRSLHAPFLVEREQLFVSASIGIALYPDDGEDGETLMKHADHAMYTAKDAGRDTFRMSSPALSQRAVERMALENSIRRGLERKEFALHYQPVVSLSSNDVVAAEALLRWQQSSGELLYPGAFLHAAEESNLILPMGEWALHACCMQMRQWRDEGNHSLTAMLNLSPRQFQQIDLAGSIRAAAEQAGIDPSMLEVEVTESTAMNDIERTLTVLHRLKDLGVKISLDDFGTGHSSLNYLKRFPIDTIKVDQSFVRDMHRDGSDAAIVAAIVAMAHALGIGVIAEGVETLRQMEMLRDLGCTRMQGFLFSRPVPPEQLAAASAAAVAVATSGNAAIM